MMKKLSKLFIVLILLVVPSRNVFADDCEADDLDCGIDSSLEIDEEAESQTDIEEATSDDGKVYTTTNLKKNEKHILFVDKLEIVDYKMTVSGYSFISHRDNYGWDGSKGNLKTYIVAYTGTWKSFYRNPSKCNSESNREKCYSVLTDLNVGADYNDLSYSRCIGDGCGEVDDRISAVASGRGEYDAACSAKDKYYCMYYNVAFQKTLNLRYIVRRFFGTELFKDLNGADESIKFKIVSTHTDVDVGATRTSDLNVFSKKCTINGDACGSSKETTTGEYKISVAGMNDKVIYDAGKSIAKVKENDGTFKNAGDNIYFLEKDSNGNKEYKVLAITDEPTEIKKNGEYSVKDYFVRLDSKLTNDNYRGKSGTETVKPDNDNKISGSNNDYWAFANWVKFSGNFEIKGFGLNLTELTCDKLSSKNNEKYNSNPKTARCDNNADVDAGFYQCNDGDDSHTVEATIYLKMGKKTDNEYDQCSSYFSTADEAGGRVKQFKNNQAKQDTYNADYNDYYYLPIKVKADIIVYQKGKFYFSNFSPTSVKAGKGFTINNSVSNGILYKNEIGWLIKYITPDREPYLFYSANKVKYQNGRCVVDDDFDLSKELSKYVTPESANNKIYFVDSSGEWEDAKLVNAAMNAINYSFRNSDKLVNINEIKDANGTNINSTTDDNIISDVVSTRFKFKSCDSNSNSTNCDRMVNVGGTWTVKFNWDSGNSDFTEDGESVHQDEIFDIYLYETGGDSFGRYWSRDYIYKLPYAYVALVDTTYSGKPYNAGDVIYSKEIIVNPALHNLSYVGNKYFVGFKYAQHNNGNENDFPFKLNNINPSMFTGMTWKLNGTCGVDVTDGYYICPEGECDSGGLDLNYRYRSISLSNPFPKANNNFSNIALNWKTWYGRSNNRTRIKNTYDKKVKYSITFTKLQSNGVFSISDIKNCNMNNKCSKTYGTLSNIDSTTGVTDFVTYYNMGKNNANSYCGLGYFASNCDNY